MERDENGFIKKVFENLVSYNGEKPEGCVASDKIGKEGYKVGFMYREQSSFDTDSGWRFVCGNEDEEYTNNPDNYHILSLNTIANYDKDVIPYLDSEVGSKFIRISSNAFEKDDGVKEIFIDKQ